MGIASIAVIPVNGRPPKSPSLSDRRRLGREEAYRGLLAQLDHMKCPPSPVRRRRSRPHHLRLVPSGRRRLGRRNSAEDSQPGSSTLSAPRCRSATTTAAVPVVSWWSHRATVPAWDRRERGEDDKLVRLARHDRSCFPLVEHLLSDKQLVSVIS